MSLSPPGLEDAFQSLLEVVQFPLTYSAQFAHLHVDAPKGVLLYGPPGVGKTHLVRAISSQCSAKLTVIQGPSILGAYLGDSERQLRAAFQAASEDALTGPSILFIDEIDSLAPTRITGMGARVVAQLLTLMDGLEKRGRLVVVGATNRPNALDAALRRPGRFDREISIPVPDQRARSRMIAYFLRNMVHDIDVDQLAAATGGYVGADLQALCREACTSAIGQRRQLRMPDFAEAMRSVAPSTRRELSTVAAATWEDVVGVPNVKQRLAQAVEWPVHHATTMQRLGVHPPRGILLHGPPGCSKTTLARVLATTSGAAFVCVDGASLFSPFVGDAERTLRDVFRRARDSRPSIVFFDEIDAVVGRRGVSRDDVVRDRVLATMLNEMDGVQALGEGVLVVAATNRIDMVDSALLRPGRFGCILYVGPPDADARREIIRKGCRGEVDLDELVRATVGFSGADLKNLAREAAMLALREDVSCGVVRMTHYCKALHVVQASLKSDLMEYYSRMQAEYG